MEKTGEREIRGMFNRVVGKEDINRNVFVKNAPEKDTTTGEEVVRIVYSTVDVGDLYHDELGRSGNYLSLTMELPKSIAEKVAPLLRKDPLLARKLVPHLMFDKENGLQNWPVTYEKKDRKKGNIV